MSVLGIVCAIFARDEYQDDAGNLCHNHLICAVDKSTLNPASDKYLQDLIRTSSMEIVTADEDVERLLANGLLKSIDEISDVIERADTILRHKCNPRCVMRIGTGAGNDFFGVANHMR